MDCPHQCQAKLEALQRGRAALIEAGEDGVADLLLICENFLRLPLGSDPMAWVQALGPAPLRRRKKTKAYPE